MTREVNSRTVYVIGVSDNPVKIGIARRVHVRLSELQIGCPDPLVIHHAVKVPYPVAKEIETEVHRELKARHRQGEWFNVHKDEALAVIESIKRWKLNAYKHEKANGGDLIDNLGAYYELRSNAREAVLDYRDRIDSKKTDYVPHANGYVLKRAGMAAYAAFSLVIAQHKPLSGLKGEELDRAHEALVRAINALADFAQDYRETKDDIAFERRWGKTRRERAA